MKKLKEDIVVLGYDYLINIVLRINGIMSSYYRKRIKNQGLSWQCSIITAFVSYDRHKYLLLLITGVSIFLMLNVQGQALNNLSQAILSACIFDFIINMISKEHTKDTVVYASYPAIERIRKRIDNVRMYLELASDYGVDEKGLSKDENFSLENKKLPLKMCLINEDIKLISEIEEKLNKKMDLKEYIEFANNRNRMDIEKLLSEIDMSVFPNVYKSLKCVQNDDRSILNFINQGFNEKRIVYSMSVIPYERVLFWSYIEMTLYKPVIIAYSKKFRKDSIRLYLNFVQYNVFHKFSQTQSEGGYKINYYKIMRKVMWLSLILLCIRNSPNEIINGIPEGIEFIFIRTSKFADIIYGFTVGVIITCFSVLVRNSQKTT